MMATEDGTRVEVYGYDINCVFRRGGAPAGNTNDTQVINLDKGESFVLEAVKNESSCQCRWLVRGYNKSN